MKRLNKIMFEINDYKFLNYNIKNKIDRRKQEKRFKKFKEKIKSLKQIILMEFKIYLLKLKELKMQ